MRGKAEGIICQDGGKGNFQKKAARYHPICHHDLYFFCYKRGKKHPNGISVGGAEERDIFGGGGGLAFLPIIRFGGACKKCPFFVCTGVWELGGGGVFVIKGEGEDI